MSQLHCAYVYIFHAFHGLVQSLECAMQSRNFYSVEMSIELFVTREGEKEGLQCRNS